MSPTKNFRNFASLHPLVFQAFLFLKTLCLLSRKCRITEDHKKKIFHFINCLQNISLENAIEILVGNDRLFEKAFS